MPPAAPSTGDVAWKGGLPLSSGVPAKTPPAALLYDLHRPCGPRAADPQAASSSPSASKAGGVPPGSSAP
eukprot:15308965-Alexandrium_andersonii.AAC.1